MKTCSVVDEHEPDRRALDDVLARLDEPKHPIPDPLWKKIAVVVLLCLGLLLTLFLRP